MPGSKSGGLKAAMTNRKKYGKDFYKKIGAIGGLRSVSVTPKRVQSMPVDINPEYTILCDGTLLGKDGNAKKPQLDGKGYLRVQVYVNGKPVTEKVHRLVARHFIANPRKLPQVNHIDGDKTNNDVSNLEWVTQAENMEHASKSGLFDHNLEAKRLAGQFLTAIEQRYIAKDICEKNGFTLTTIKRYLANALPEPITDLRLGRRVQLYYYDSERGKYRVVKKDTGLESAQFDTENEAVEYIESQSRAGGFAANRELAVRAGRLGGSRSRRNKKAVCTTEGCANSIYDNNLCREHYDAIVESRDE